MLRCDECDAVATGDARGWAAFSFQDPDDPDEPIVVLYCPACAERELGEPPPRSLRE